MFRSTLLITMLALAACGAKKTPAAASADGAPAEETIDNAKIPDDKASKDFAKRLVKFDAKDFRPTDAPGARLTYKTIDFRGDNTWLAMAEMSAGGETVECKEQGKWEMDPATDEHTASMTWTLDRTTCAGRPETDVMRLKVNIDEGEYRIVFR